jgi:hypothetical protein
VTISAERDEGRVRLSVADRGIGVAPELAAAGGSHFWIELPEADGANSYLVKPVAFEALLDRVQAIDLYWLVMNQSPAPAEPS